MKNKKLLALIAALLVIAAVVVVVLVTRKPATEEGKVFKMGIDAEYPPFSYLDDDGKYAGFDVEMCQAVCDQYGWELEIVPLTGTPS